MADQIPTGMMRDSKGRLVPVELVKDVDKLRDQLVRSIVAKAQVLAAELASLKRAAMADIAAFVALSGETYGVKLGGAKGNLSLLTFDGEYRVVVAIAEYQIFDERLQAAKALIDECIHEWSAGTRAELQTLINDAFAVDKTGKLNTNRILGLRRLDISDDRWKRAMQAISDSLQVVGSKSYIRIYKRDKDGEYQLQNLDIAAL